ncbi:VOC family protein [Sphingomonas asaccharolytica]|uniref:VOC family protein n=1 Tax=Sphingomonas asaccharolytica TaxID=40681 RepID=UPI00082C9DC4|nr:VOC family protein [Sphingomonas asaccharolytica]
MLGVKKIVARLPVQDLDRARAWYAEKLGLTADETRPGGVRYVIGSCEFALFVSAGKSDGAFTQLGFEVEDLRAAVAQLRSNGVVFEDYSEGRLRTEDSIATIQGNYPSKGAGEYAAWFRDSEGNMLGISEPF